jgi:polysaccharide pyruvyl transferase WcaK-like protein
MRQIGAKPKELIETTDDAAGLPSENLPDRIYEFLRSKPTVAMNVTRYTTDTADKRVTFRSLFYRLISQYQVLLIPHDPEDHAFLQTLRSVPANEALFWDTNKSRAGQIKWALEHCSFAVGGRYHFGVFCAAVGIPFVMLTGSNYSYVKNMGLAGWIGAESFVVDADDLDRANESIDRIAHHPPSCHRSLPASTTFSRLRKWLEELA